MLKFVRNCASKQYFKSEKYLLKGLKNSERNQSTDAKLRDVGSIGIYKDTSHLIDPKYSNLSYAMSNTNGLHLLCDSFADRIETMAKHRPNDVCYKFSLTQTQFTFLEMKQRCEEIAQNFLDMGFKKGDRLAVFLPNIPENNLTVLAAASIGLIVVMMNPAYQLVEVEHMLKKTKAKGIVMLDNLKILQHYEMLKKICAELETSLKGELNSKNLPDLKHVIIANNRLFKDPNQKTKGTWNFSELEKFNKQKVEKPRVDMDDSLVILFTVSNYYKITLKFKNIINIVFKLVGYNRIS